MRNVTLCILVKEEKLLLGMKKKGFGAGNYNGFGGKLKENEILELGAVRELFEEVGIKANPEYLHKKAELSFTFPHKPEWNQVVHVYLVDRWEGEPNESDEMKPEWFDIDKIPYEKMWEADSYWIPHILEGKYVNASFVYGENKEILEKSLKFD